jgi:ketosteroid isomerase-like protein
MFEEKKQVVQRYLDRLGGAESDIWQAITDNWHEDAYWKLIGNTARSGTFRGLEAIKRDFMGVGRRGDGREGPSVQGLSSEYPVTMTVDEVVATEDGRVIVFCQSDARGRNGLLYQNEYCWVFEVEGDKIAGLVEFCDTVAIEEVHFDKKLVPRGTTTAVYET